MAKYVLVAFEDDARADEFVRRFTEDVEENARDTRSNIYAYIRGVWRKPTKFCECSISGVGIKKRAFTRGRKYGWWVCSQCKRPTVGYGRGDHWFLALGRNLLPVDNRAPEYRGDGVFARHFKPCEGCGTTLVAEVGHAQTEVYCHVCGVWR